MTNSEIAGSTARPAAFRFRFGEPADLPHCVPLLPPGFRANDSIRSKLVDLWSRIPRTFCVVEDIGRKHPAGIEGFGLTAFVSDEFADEICASPRPYVSALFYERMLEGRDGVPLTSPQIAKANATTGLNLLVLHFGLRNHDLSDARTVQALMAGSAGFFFFHTGYRIKMIINEVFGSQARQYMANGFDQLAKDFQHEAPAAFAGVSPEDYPYLFLLRREWVKPAAVNPLSQLFLSPAPQLFFSAAERHILERALLNESDAQIAKSLGISIDRVKKTWRNAFARVNRGAPHLIPASDLETRGARGQEKRRYLLAYLRIHLEELRPFKP
jgi:hypothetical protein